PQSRARAMPSLGHAEAGPGAGSRACGSQFGTFCKSARRFSSSGQLLDAGHETDAAEGDLAGTRVAVDVVGLARAVGEQAHAALTSAKRMRDASARSVPRVFLSTS